jgi:hypothetical protein
VLTQAAYCSPTSLSAAAFFAAASAALVGSVFAGGVAANGETSTQVMMKDAVIVVVPRMFISVPV